VPRNSDGDRRDRRKSRPYSAKGVERELSLCLLPDNLVAPGDFVMAYISYAIEKMTAGKAGSA
jgi:hypothetical protein